MLYLGESIKKLGFGLMRLPMIGDDVDIEQTKQMVDLFIDSGFTYFDTAYGYLNGKSEEAVKTAIVDRYPRSIYQLATKLPAWAAKNADDALAMFETSLKRTGAEYFDFYLLHNLGAERTEVFERYGIWDYLMKQKEKGLIRHLGFSFHDKAAALDEVLNKHPEAEFVQLQINYADWESETVESRKCYEVACKHGKPVVIMEPVKGGSLAKLPDDIASILKEENPKASLASWAIRYAASLDGLITVLSGMSALEQMEDNLSYMNAMRLLNVSERAALAQVQEKLQNLPKVPCTDCRYCIKGCPKHVVIPNIFIAMNNYLVYNNLKAAKGNYMFYTRNGGLASECIACGQCESVCPQHIKIIDELKKAADVLENKN